LPNCSCSSATSLLPRSKASFCFCLASWVCTTVRAEFSAPSWSSQPLRLLVLPPASSSWLIRPVPHGRGMRRTGYAGGVWGKILQKTKD
jgi:hypothetical protein